MKASIVLALAGLAMLWLSAAPWPQPAPSTAGARAAPTVTMSVQSSAPRPTPSRSTAGARAAPTATVSSKTPAERGKILFRAKSCSTCHTNRRVGPENGIAANAPNLTEYRRDPEFLRRWLADPSAVKPGTQMPNLQLSPAEIEGLIAFLNEPR